MQSLVLFAAWTRREWILRIRYIWDTLAELFTGYAVFVLLALGARITQIERMRFGAAQRSLIVAFMVLTLVMASYRRLASSVAREAAAGTLEQIAMSPLGSLAVWSTRVGSIFFSSLFFAAVQLLLMMLTTGHWLSLDIPSLLPVLALTYASGQGVGLILRGLAIMYKQVQELFQLGSWTFLGLTLFSPMDFPVLKYLPVSWGTELSRRLMLSDMHLWHFSAADLAFLFAHGSAWLAFGMVVFLSAERRARNDGSLGHY